MIPYEDPGDDGGEEGKIPGVPHLVHPGRERVCRLCGASAPHPQVRVREMMFGTRERFTYFACTACGCLQIAEIPEDPSRHYPAERYYAHRPPRRRRGLGGRLKRLRDRAVLGLGGPGGRLLSWCVPYPRDGGLRAVARVSPPVDAQILDVGCGSGQLLRDLRGAGYRHLVGVDPHLDLTGEVEGVELVRGEIQDVGGAFDLIMFHHVLEHVQDPLRALQSAAERLRPGGECILRLPVFPSEAWRRYGPAWVQIDGPRHLHIPGRRALDLLAQKAELATVEVWYDSTHFQFTASEGYLRGVPLAEQDPPPRRERRRRDREAARLNAAERGDQIGLRLRKG